MQPAPVPMEASKVTQVFLLNRMVLPIARRVKRLFVELHGVAAREVQQPEDLPAGGVELLIVGRQQLRDDGDEMRLGYPLLDAAVRQCQPRAVVYVVPSRFEPDRYLRDREVLARVAQHTPVLVLEFGALWELEIPAAAQRARINLERSRRQRSGRVELLLGNPADHAAA